jgi:hypothetical protein
MLAMQSMGGNAFAQSMLQTGVGDALVDCFGPAVAGVEIHGGEDAPNDDIGALGSAEGHRVSLSSDLDPAQGDRQSLEVLGHEVAHAMAGGGSGENELDQPGDPGEARADAAGARFAAYVAGGMRGPAPRLQAATGGRAQVHRFKTEEPGPATACEAPKEGEGTPPWFEYPSPDKPNLKGSPPVKDREAPPNKAIIEDEGVYAKRLSAANASLDGQVKRADSLWNDEHQDNRYWFARVYQYVTEGEIAQAEAGGFYYPSYALASVMYFDKVYGDNFNAWSEGRTEDVEAHWKEAFQTCVDNQDSLAEDIVEFAISPEVWAMDEVLSVVESLVASMQAHIRYDLPRCEAWVFDTLYANMPGAKLSDFHPDFVAMGGIFDRAGARMNDDMAEKLNLPVDWTPPGLQDWAMAYVLDAEMTTERNDTWMRGEELVSKGLLQSSPYTLDTEGNLKGDVTDDDHDSSLQKLPERLRPSMDDSAEVLDDDTVRAEAGDKVIDAPCGDATIEALKKRSTTERIDMIRGSVRGFTFNGDEASVLNILEASRQKGDLLSVMSGARPYDLASHTHGQEWALLRDRFFKPHFYPKVGDHPALELLMACMVGYTGGWSEDMIVDLFLARDDESRDWLVKQLGKHIGGATGDDDAKRAAGREALRAEIGDRLNDAL